MQDAWCMTGANCSVTGNALGGTEDKHFNKWLPQPAHSQSPHRCKTKNKMMSVIQCRYREAVQ